MSGQSFTHQLKIEGMHCASCAMGIDLQLEDVPGVISAETSFAKSVTVLRVDTPEFDLSVIRTAVEDLGYGLAKE